MIITRTPLRIPIGGGGTDLPDFYEKYGSFFISAAIDYYIYLAVKERPVKGIRLAYSRIEEVDSIDQIQHAIVKACLQYVKTKTDKGLEIISIGDLPAGTGIGSSGSFTVGLLNALHHMQKKAKPANILAQEACHINIDILQKPSGKQDEYIASYGGFTCFEINRAGKTKSYPLKITSSTINRLQNNLLMFYTGISRNSSDVLSKQANAIKRNDKSIINNLLKIQEIGYMIKEALEDGNCTRFGKLLHKHWQVKKTREAATNQKINRWYTIATTNGALGGKLMGAGGGGYFVFYCENKKEQLRKALLSEGLEEVYFHFDFEGSKLLVNL